MQLWPPSTVNSAIIELNQLLVSAKVVQLKQQICYKSSLLMSREVDTGERGRVLVEGGEDSFRARLPSCPESES